MSLIASDKGGGDFKKIPQGTHMAVCNMIIDLGYQRGEWAGEEKIQHKCYVRWEIQGERIEWKDADGNEHEGPMTIGKQYTVGLGDKYTMKADLEAWRGKAFTDEEKNGFKVESLLGTCCQINVSHKVSGQGKEYAKVDGLAAWPKGLDRIKAENDLFFYDSESGNHDDLPKWAKEAISKQVHLDASAPVDSIDDDFDDDIPF